ncbi:hypothetical protein HYV49_01140 [Candidatus Pacearchaeota archaeon]|nr:hypothetical protein [Candidatus Pacearchaeota archaeon]
MKRLPIEAAKYISKKYDLDQVLVLSFDKKDGIENYVSYGKTKEDCRQAAIGIDRIREFLKYGIFLEENQKGE